VPDALSNLDARERWSRHRKYLGDFDRDWIASGRLAQRFGSTIVSELSAGAWREYAYRASSEYPAIQPQHERRKFLAARGRDDRVLIKFAGLASYGENHHRRDVRLADAGFAPDVAGFADGFVAFQWTDGRPMERSDANPEFLRTAARYLAWIRCNERTGTTADPQPLIEMMELNIREGLGAGWSASAARVARMDAAIRGQTAVRIDGRMMPHEWLRTSSGFIKTDGSSHYDDHFYPGIQDIAWDLAGLSIEFDLGEAAEKFLVAEYIARSEDTTISDRLPFFRVAYLAFRLGYTTLSTQALGSSADGTRMGRERHRFARRLGAELGCGMAADRPTESSRPYAGGGSPP
jgi:hypothetical protein